MSVVQLRPERERKPGPYKAGRRCKVTTCRKGLSVYNHMDICNACWLAEAAQWRAANMSHSEEDPALLAHAVRRDYARRNRQRGLSNLQVLKIRQRYLTGECSRTRIARDLGFGLDAVRAALCPNNYKDAPLFAEMMEARRQRGDTQDEYRGLRKVRREKAEAGELVTVLGDIGHDDLPGRMAA